MLSPSQLIHISHPHVTSAYIKQDLAAETAGKQVLVIETDIDVAKAENEDEYLDLLMDLKDIRSRAQKQFGYISRIDIKGATFH